MTDNPLMTTPAAGKKRGPVTVEQLFGLRDSLNRSPFVRESGRPYFVGTFADDHPRAGKRFLGREGE